MAYALTSRKDLSSPTPEEHTDTPVSNQTEYQVTTQSQISFVPQELSESHNVVLPTQEANLTQSALDIADYVTTKPETESDIQLNPLGPVRLDPGLISSATLSAGIPSAGTFTMDQELAPAQASAFVPQSTDTASLQYIPRSRG